MRQNGAGKDDTVPLCAGEWQSRLKASKRRKEGRFCHCAPGAARRGNPPHHKERPSAWSANRITFRQGNPDQREECLPSAARRTLGALLGAANTCVHQPVKGVPSAPYTALAEGGNDDREGASLARSAVAARDLTA